MAFKLPPALRALTKADPTAPESRWCLLVAERVGFYFVPPRFNKSQDELKRKAKRYGHDLSEELFAAGLTALIGELLKHPDLPLRAQKCVIDHAINDAKLTDQNIYVKPATNRKRKQRGQKLFRFKYERDNDEVETSILRTLREPDRGRTDWPEVIDCFKRIREACRHENDARVLEACWDEGRSIGHGPPKMNDLMRTTGLSRNKILECMNHLEAEAIKILKWRKPKRRRKHRK
jgi:hypothetical protein